MMWRSREGARDYVLWAAPDHHPEAAPPCPEEGCQAHTLLPPTTARPWTLGVLANLDPRDPLGSYRDEVRFCLDLSPQPLSAWDEMSLRPLAPEDLARIAGEGCAPDATWLYTIHQVTCDRRGRSWIHTHGLARAGIPDLDLLRWPGRLAEAGVDLLRHLARRWIGRRPPPPRMPFRIAKQSEIAWIPLAEALPTMREREYGGPRDRRLIGRAIDHRGVLVETPLSKDGWRPPLKAVEEWAAYPDP